MVGSLLDSNILIDQLRLVPQARAELARYDDRAISIITWIEVMVGAPPALEDSTRVFLSGFVVVNVDASIAEEASQLRRAYRLKLPDAIIWASARRTGRLFVTRNTKDFPSDDPGVRIPYRLYNQ